MKKTTGILMVGVACGFAAAGCSSTTSDPFGPAPDFGQVEAKYQKPTGTFRAGSEGSVLSGLGSQTKAHGSGFGVGAGTATTKTAADGAIHLHSVHILDGSTSGASGSFCPALQSGQASGSCACPSGGSIAYDMSGMQALKGYKGGPIDVTLKVRASACSANGATVDGTEFAKIKSNGTPTDHDLLMLYDIHLTASLNQVTTRIDADFEYLNGAFWYAITVDDGTIVVSSDPNWDQATKTGKIHVRDRNESWTCDFANGKGSCTSDKGNAREVASL